MHFTLFNGGKSDLFIHLFLRNAKTDWNKQASIELVSSPFVLPEAPFLFLSGVRGSN